jgi:hypothetical protein
MWCSCHMALAQESEHNKSAESGGTLCISRYLQTHLQACDMLLTPRTASWAGPVRPCAISGQPWRANRHIVPALKPTSHGCADTRNTRSVACMKYTGLQHRRPTRHWRVEPAAQHQNTPLHARHQTRAPSPYCSSQRAVHPTTCCRSCQLYHMHHQATAQ